MTVISIKKKGRKYIVKFSNYSSLCLEPEIINKFAIFIDADFSDEQVELIIHKNEIKKTSDSAFRILARRNHSKYELKTKLMQRKYDSEVVEETINNLAELGYLDDQKFAEEYSHYSVFTKKYGQIKIINELKRRGVGREIIESIIKASDEERFFTNAKEIAIKKNNQLKEKEYNSYKLQEKLMMHLRHKGYNSDTIRKVLKELNI